MTGAPAPQGTTVVPIERTNLFGAPVPHASLTHKTLTTSVEVTVTDLQALAPNRNIARQGEDGCAGDIIIRAGTILGPATVACAAMAGANQLTVARPPQLAIITTGDEVGGQGAAAINDSNGPFLVAFCAALGIPTVRAHAVDDAIALRAALVNAFDRADLVVTSGGVSAGDKDLVPVLATSLGLTTIFHHLAIQPGKPVFLARRGDGKLLVGLPGNPVSVIATAHLILLPVIRRLMGLPPAGTWELVPLGVSWSNPGKRRLFLPARRTPQGVMPIRWNGSGDLVAAAAADCFIDLAPGANHAAGHELPVLPMVGTPPGATAVLPRRCR
jgi:molybdopterin molybdotransferase